MAKDRCMETSDSSGMNNESTIRRMEELRRQSGDPSPSLRIYSAIIQQSPIGVSVRDRNGNLVLCNRAWSSIWEMSSERVQAALRTRKDKLELDEKDRYLGRMQEDVISIYEKGGDLVLDPILLERSGKWIQQRFYGIEGDSGGNEYVVILTEDVTEREKAKTVQAELQRSNLKYRSLVKNLPVAAYTTNSEGRCISANPAMVRMFEEDSVEDLYRKPVTSRYLNPSDRDEFLQQMAEHGQIRGYEVELVTRNDRPFWASISATATFDDNGRLLTVDGVIRDVSAEKILEREMIKSQKLESLGILAGGIAHDFNNIMAAVLGNISLAKLNAAGDPRITEKLDEAERATIRASELTRQLLTFSRGGKPVRKICDIRGIIRESATFASTGSRSVIEFNLPEGLWATEADESQIGQVINNLVLNSVQASPEGCRITITASNAELTEPNRYALKAGKYVRLAVRDDGPGIPGPVQDRIFDPYFSTKSSGSGLGLATVYSVIRNHAGSVTLDSSHDKGTVFIIHLPSPGIVADPGIGEKSAGSFGKGRILVMDDEESVRNVVTGILEYHGYSTDSAPEGLTAIELYRTAFLDGSPYDVVITDVTVPGGIGGVETAQQILRLDPSAKLILVSGYANNSAMAHYREHGFRDSIVKPFTMDVLLRSLEKVLND